MRKYDPNNILKMSEMGTDFVVGECGVWCSYQQNMHLSHNPGVNNNIRELIMYRS